MSKLRERIGEASQRRAAPLGFGRPQSHDERRYVLVMAEVADAPAASAAVEAGVDALLYSGGVEGVAAIVEAAGDRPVGARVPAATAADTEGLVDAKVDFLLFGDATTEAAALLPEELGYVVRLEDVAASDDELRLLQPLALDAILVPGHEGTLSVREQLLTRRIAEIARKPLIAPVSPAIAAIALQVWRDAGAPVVLAPGSDRAALERLVATSREVPAPREPREERAEALVPAAAPQPSFEEDEED